MDPRAVYIVEYGGIYDGSGIEKVFSTYEDAESYVSQMLVTLNEDIKRRHGVALEKKLFQKQKVDYYELYYSTTSTYIGISKYDVQ